MTDLVKDRLFLLAEKYVEETSVPVFLTGKAGTGKTTFLRYITEHTSKRTVVLAPTGVAAVNARGSTIHSFFSLPLCPYLPDVPELKTEYQMPERRRRLRKEKMQIIRTLDLLIIDEISMVRADLLDAVDMTLRSCRRSSRPFGGVQLLMIGDASQLSPVVKESEREYIEKVYPSPYFFHSKALSALPYITLELETIYRQSDAEFISILNGVRDNCLTPGMLAKLNARVGPAEGLDSWIRLTTHNRQADRVNAAKMASLSAPERTFEADISGDFPESQYPADLSLTLKEGAQVMFIRNDPDGQFYNGKIGRVVRMGADHVVVAGEDGGDIRVAPMTWENLQYDIDEASGEIVQQVAGTFSQIPLRLAWAITIHKSQGLTFDHVIIDAAAAFAFGQVYVALSRSRSLEGIVLTSPLNRSMLLTDEAVAQFRASFPPPSAVSSGLPAFQEQYRIEQIADCFSFERLRMLCFALRRIWREGLATTYPAQTEVLESAARDAADLEEVAARFRRQVSRIGGDEAFLTERIGKAADYFLPRIQAVSAALLPLLEVEIDSKEVRKRVESLAADLTLQLQIHQETLREVQSEGFEGGRYSRTKVRCLMGGPERGSRKAPKARKAVPDSRDVYQDNRHPELVSALVQWRRTRSAELGVPAYIVLHQKTLLSIADAAPSTRAELLQIPGFGPGLDEKFGEEILSVLRSRQPETSLPREA